MGKRKAAWNMKDNNENKQTMAKTLDREQSQTRKRGRGREVG